MKFFRGFGLAVLLIVILAGCSSPPKTAAKQEDKKQDIERPFISDAYGFSFRYPGNWEEVTKDLPDRWALLDVNKNTILFIVSQANTDDILILGKSQALADMYEDQIISDLSQEQIEEVEGIVKIESFNEKEWFTYGISFDEHDVNSIISGTLCGNNEITLVYVNDHVTYELNRNIYVNMLNSFKC